MPEPFPRLAAASLCLTLLAGCGGERDARPQPPAAAGETLAPSKVTVRPSSDEPPRPSVDEPDSQPEAPRVDPIPLALRNLTSDEAADRREAVHVLSNAEYDEGIGDEVTTGLIRRLADSQADIREASVVALRKWARPEHVGRIAPLLGRGEKEIRHSALLVLGTLRTPESAEAVAAQLVTAFDRAAAANALREIGPDAEAVLLETYLEDTDPNVRLVTVEVLGEIGGTASIDPLVERTQEEENDPRVQTAAAQALMMVEGR